jgi:hypothetical protein
MDKQTLERIMRPAPTGLGVVPVTTPVVSFGDISRARIATISINPSHREFVDSKGALLAPGKKRLVDRESLAGAFERELTKQDAQAVLDGCNSYFTHGKTYGWFKTMQAAALDPFNIHYASGSACHLDLVQWATYPIWRDLSNAQRQQLLQEDSSFLAHQLKSHTFSLVLMNGQQVVSQLTEAGIIDSTTWYTDTYETKSGPVKYSVYTGRNPAAPDPLFVGWSFYVQNMRIPMEARKAVVASINARLKAEYLGS